MSVRCSSGKGLDTLLEALALAPNLRLRVIGDGSENERFDLRHKIRELALNPALNSAGGCRSTHCQRRSPAQLAPCMRFRPSTR